MTHRGTIILAPLGALYGAVMRARAALYSSGALRVHRIDATVISVGNITTGGTGKTPLVEWLARAVASRSGKRVCILTRGYGRADERERVIVSDGERLLADARLGGDEPRLLAESLTGVAAVISDADRVAAARWAIEHLASEVFILDDGFQNLRIARDLDIVTVDATAPFGGGRMLPRGRLREPARGLARADVVIITRADQVNEIDKLRREIERLSGGRPTFLSRTRTRGLLPLSPDDTGAWDSSSPRTVAAFCAIGNAGAFFAHLKTDGHQLVYTRAFPDHHVYSQSDVQTIEEQARSLGAQALLTTAKDGVKLRALKFDLPCFVVEIEIEIDGEDRLLGLLDGALLKKERPA
ncbi:MAG TPA: tetraacyldisaccharide 4'-kinase [Pyrinomonadaceae bacterium]|jgi:tetraacyldisaccharide 4'-kinase|nr:tetraacyldisaccharide 4'-kinase [Pyrinomonadaceae bacterium]